MEPPGGRLEMVVRRLPLYALGAFVLMTTLMTVLAWSTFQMVAPTPDFSYLDGPRWLDVWFQGDAGWYYLIAEKGYSYTPGQQSPIAFFPTYPLLVHGVGELISGDFSTAAGLITLICAAGVVMLFADWVRTRVQPRTAVVAVAVLLVYPYSFFLYGTGYSDASFLLSTLGAFALLERRKYVLAGIVGAVATAGRPVGIAVTVGLVVRAAELIAADRAARRDAGVLVGSTAGPGFAAAGPPDDARAERAGPVPFRELLQAVPFMRWRQAALLVSGAGLL